MIEDALVIWPERTPDVDLILEPKTMEIKFNSVKAIYAFDILGFYDPGFTLPTLRNFFSMLQPEGELYIIENDFDYINRAYMGGDLSLEEFNKDFRRGTYFNNAEINRLLNKSGFPEKTQKIWYKGLQFQKKHYQIIISGKKPILK